MTPTFEIASEILIAAKFSSSKIGEIEMATSKKNNSKVVKNSKKVVEQPEKVEVQLPAAQLPAATSRAKEQPMWDGKPISAAGLVYHQRREAGVCVKCGQPLAEGSKLLCNAHLAYHNQWHANRKAKIDAAMALLAKQTAPVAQTAVAATVEAAPTAPVKPAVKAAKSKDLAALKATQPAKPAKKTAKK